MSLFGVPHLKKIFEFGLLGKQCGIPRFHYFQVLVHCDLVWYLMRDLIVPCTHNNLVLVMDTLFYSKSMHDMNCIVSSLGILIAVCFSKEAPVLRCFYNGTFFVISSFHMFFLDNIYMLPWHRVINRKKCKDPDYYLTYYVT